MVPLDWGISNAAGLSTGSPTGQGIWKTSAQFGVRTLIERKSERRGEPRGSSKSHLESDPSS